MCCYGIFILLILDLDFEVVWSRDLVLDYLFKLVRKIKVDVFATTIISHWSILISLTELIGFNI